MISILLYHGTTIENAESIVNEGIKLSCSNRFLDFGPGFYTTPDIDFAVTNGERKYNAKLSKKSKGYAVLCFEIDELAFSQLKQHFFFKVNDSWAKFIVANRCKNDEVCRNVFHNRDAKFDIVIGDTADGSKGSLTILADEVANNKRYLESISVKDVNVSNNVNWGTQWSFHTPKSLACLTLTNVIYYKR